jgi:hypothetical protein
VFSCSLEMDFERPHDATLRASPHQGQPPRRIVLRLSAEGVVVVALLASLWWGISILGAHAFASESSAPAPVYVVGCPLDDTPQKGSAGGGCSKEGASHPMSSRQPGGGLASEHAHGAEK